MNRISGKLTYANVVASLALFVALAGGTAFAASQILPKNSVGTKQIKNSAVTPAKLSSAAKSTLTGAQGPVGPQGPKGDEGHRGEKGEAGPSTGPAGGALSGNFPNPTLAGPEALHLVGSTGQPVFASGVSNSSGGTPTGFYKDGFGIVHLQGEVDAPASHELFELPAGFIPQHQTCGSASAFVSGNTFTTNRICVEPGGKVYNDRGTGTGYISLNELTFRTDN